MAQHQGRLVVAGRDLELWNLVGTREAGEQDMQRRKLVCETCIEHLALLEVGQIIAAAFTKTDQDAAFFLYQLGAEQDVRWPEFVSALEAAGLSRDP